MRIRFMCLVLFTWLSTCFSFPFITLLPITGAIVTYIAKDKLECFVRECCSEAMLFNETGLRDALSYELHGQHIARERVFNHISAHIQDSSPKKALALSFHGYTGVGKNFVANLMASYILKYGVRSRFYHFYDSTIHFLHHGRIHEYKEQLHSELRNAVLQCSHSIFVFDEMHNMPSGLLDVLSSALEIRDSIDGVDFRRSIFIFLSNAGGSAINRRVYDHLLSGKRREALVYSDFEGALAHSSFNDEGGLRYSELIQKHLITAMIPFLPLQVEHVTQCIRDAALERDVLPTEDLINFVLDELEWYPENSKFFSVSGCKRVYEKVGFYKQQNIE